MQDIIDAIDRIESFTHGMTFEDFVADDRTVDAVEYRLVIIGEAANHLPSEIQARVAGVPWAAIRAMRNRLTHEYFGIRLQTVWETAKVGLPELRAALLPLLVLDE